MQEEERQYSRINSQDSYATDLTPLVQLLLDNSNTINLMSHNLRGEVLKYEMVEMEDGRKVPMEKWEGSGFRKMNDEGVKFVVSKLQAYLNTNVNLSQFTDDQIAVIMQGFHLDLMALVDDMQDEWEIRAAYKGDIVREICDNVWASFNKALGAKTLQTIARANTSTEIREIQPKKRSWIPFIH